MSVANFYADKSVFITGASGFLGKVLVEKLLRSCPQIGTIFVLLRDKKGKTSDERIVDLVNGKVFEMLNKLDPRRVSKVKAVCGDLAAPGLGILSEDRKKLISEVNVVFHVGATVKFNEPLKRAMQVNLGGTASVLQLCRDLQKLEALVYVSTAFSNCERQIIEEKIYPAPVDPSRLMDAVQWLDSTALEALLPCINGGKKNTYILTKALAETYIETEGKGLPIAIVRPSIVGPSHKEPFPGWVDVAHGGIGAVLALASGSWRNSWSREDAIVYAVPVDQCVNILIAAAWDLGTSEMPHDGLITGTSDKEVSRKAVKVYNFDSGMTNPMKWSIILKSVIHAARNNYCLENAIWIPSHKRHRNWLSCKLSTLIEEKLVAHLTDLARRIFRKKPFAVELHNRVQNMTSSLRYFMIVSIVDFESKRIDYFMISSKNLNQSRWEMQSENVPRLLDRLTLADRVMFDFDIKKNDWAQYGETFVLGLRTHLLKQEPATISSSIRRMKRFRLFRISAKVMFTLLWLLIIVKLAGLDSW